MDARSKLLNRKNELEKIIKEKQELLMTPLQETTDELSAYDQHPADIADSVYEREKDFGMLELMELELEKVNDALHKYDSGQYGICEVCGNTIEPQRLERVVNTTLCSQCAKQRFSQFKRPAEEDVLDITVMSDKGESFQIAGFEFYEHE